MIFGQKFATAKTLGLLGIRMTTGATLLQSPTSLPFNLLVKPNKTMAERTVKREYKPVPDYRPGDPDADPYKLILAREQRAREAMVAIEETSIIAEKLAKCYRKEGVNHHVNCEKLARAYLRRISRPGFKEGPVELADIE